MFRCRHRHGRRGRFPKPIWLEGGPPIIGLDPVETPGKLEPVYLELAELEAFRLVDLEGLSQEEAGGRMGVSRGTVWRLVQSARRKAAQALSEGRPIRIASSTPDSENQSNT